MAKVNIFNFIVPSNTDTLGEPYIHNEFIFCVYEIYFSICYDLGSAKYIGYSDRSVYFQKNLEDGKYIVKYGLGMNADWYLFEKGDLIPFADNEIIEESFTKQYDNYSVVEKDHSHYEFLHRDTNKRIEFKRKGYVFIAERCGYIYFKDTNKPKTLVCMNEEFKIIKSYSYEGWGFGMGQCLDQYLFHKLKTKPLTLEIFDLDNFTPVARHDATDGLCPIVYRIHDTYHIFLGGSLFLWDGVKLKKHDFNKNISAHLVKRDFLYIGFDNDTNLYAYKPTSLELIHQQNICLKDFQVLRFSTSGQHNACSLRPFDTTFGQYYFVCWSDDEFFGDPWEVVEESPIYNESQVDDGNLFFLRINIDASHDYLTIVRQSLAIIDDTIVRHSASTIPSDADKPYSEAFNGVIEACYNNSRHLADEYRKQLTDTCKKIEEFYWVARGYAKGDPQPIRVNVVFND
jgi:hypothetical protein